jgi:Zn-dependent peptidase ImmA (M78 family)/transcriptional regulator with XRE-family HTH domain
LTENARGPGVIADASSGRSRRGDLRLRLRTTGATRQLPERPVNDVAETTWPFCATISRVDVLDLGRRVAQARDVADITQEGLGRAVGLDRAAIKRLEDGDRKLDVTEIAAIAHVLGRPLSFFVDPPVPAVVTRRADKGLRHSTSRALDIELDQFAGDVRTLLDVGVISPVARIEGSAPDDQIRAEQMAKAIRSRLGMDLGMEYEAVHDLGQACERLGLYTYSTSLGKAGPDGASVEVSGEYLDVGAAVINGDAPAGQRRVTLAHQLGHWLCEDPYGSCASPESENMIHSFAIHFLAPRAGLHMVWSEHDDWSDRDRALAVNATYRLSWSATLNQLKNLGIIDVDGFQTLGESEPRLGDYLRLGFSWTDELTSPYLSPGLVSACVNGYADGKLTQSRSLELLRGTVTAQDLPQKHARTLNDIRASFTGHDG